MQIELKSRRMANIAGTASIALSVLATCLAAHAVTPYPYSIGQEVLIQVLPSSAGTMKIVLNKADCTSSWDGTQYLDENWTMTVSGPNNYNSPVNSIPYAAEHGWFGESLGNPPNPAVPCNTPATGNSLPYTFTCQGQATYPYNQYPYINYSTNVYVPCDAAASQYALSMLTIWNSTTNAWTSSIGIAMPSSLASSCAYYFLKDTTTGTVYTGHVDVTIGGCSIEVDNLPAGHMFNYAFSSTSTPPAPFPSNQFVCTPLTANLGHN